MNVNNSLYGSKSTPLLRFFALHLSLRSLREMNSYQLRLKKGKVGLRELLKIYK